MKASIVILFCIIVLICVAAKCQDVPNSPSTSQPPAPAIEKHCGPKWMGGCWKYDRPQLGWGETFKSKKFLIPTLALTAFAGWDYATTDYFSHNGHYRGDPNSGPCMERNQYLGQRPGAGDFAKDFALTHLPVIAFGYFFTKGKLPHWIYDGIVTYGVVIHAKGATRWYTECW